jgi:carbon storage regulator
MLVLTRKKSERIKIGDAMVTIVDIGRGRVRIGIDAPKNVPISRPDDQDERGEDESREYFPR